jgi:uncharacterized protein YprB with RNaseH-like and TPR domain
VSFEELRKRLERLNRGPVPGLIRPASELPTATTTHSVLSRRLSLEAVVPGRVAHVGDLSFYSIERHLGCDGQPGATIVHRLLDAVREATAGVQAHPLHPDFTDSLACGTTGLLFTDLETCGFFGTPIFLIGTMYVDPTGLRVEQLFARNYAQEAGILTRFGQLFQARPRLVTFNGKAFDWPFIAGRAVVCRVPIAGLQGHCDLLHAARRRFRTALPDCRLQTLERYVCGRRRVGDLPSSEVPSAYHAFVRSGDAYQVREIVEHNFLDLITLAELLTELLLP